MVSSPKIVMNLPRTFEKLHCKGESGQFQGQFQGQSQFKGRVSSGAESVPETE